MNVQKYIAFTKTVELGSITKAASVLGYTQSGISHMIQSLENECGMKLLYRDRSGIRLTAEGGQLLPYFSQICSSEHQLDNKIKELLGMDAGLIRIGTFTSVSVQWLPYIIKMFREDYPNIEFELLYGEYADIENWIMRGRVDCGFLRLPPRQPVETVFLKQDELAVIMPLGHPLCKMDAVPLKALEQYPFIQMDEGEDYEIDAIFDAGHITPRVQFTAKDDHTIISLVANGLGISVMPKLVLQGLPYDIVIKPFELPIHRQLGIAYKSKNMLSAITGHFLEYVKRWIADKYGI